MSAWKNRSDGKEAPYYALGPFKIRLPFLHYRFELPDYLQGLLMCAVDLCLHFDVCSLSLSPLMCALYCLDHHHFQQPKHAVCTFVLSCVV